MLSCRKFIAVLQGGKKTWNKNQHPRSSHQREMNPPKPPRSKWKTIGIISLILNGLLIIAVIVSLGSAKGPASVHSFTLLFSKDFGQTVTIWDINV